MDAALQLLLCDIESDLYSAKELLEKAPCISDEINIDEIIERATFLTSLIKKNNDEIESFLEKSLSTAKSFFERYSAVKYKYRKDDQCKLKIGQYDSEFYEAMIKSDNIGQVAFNI